MKLVTLLVADGILVLSGTISGLWGKSCLLNASLEQSSAVGVIALAALAILIVAAILVVIGKSITARRKLFVSSAVGLIVIATMLALFLFITLGESVSGLNGQRIFMGVVGMAGQLSAIWAAIYLVVRYRRQSKE